MSVADFFTEQFEELELFLLNPKEVVRRVLVDAEFRPMLLKYLVRREEEPDFPHVLIAYDEPFKDPWSWFDSWLQAFSAELSQHGLELASDEVQIDRLNPQSPARFLARVDSFAHSLPDNVGALAFVIDTAEVLDPDGFRRAIKFLADYVQSPWLKFIVLDSRFKPCLDEIAGGHDRISSQCFWLSPDEVQRRAETALATQGDQPTPERRQNLALAAGVAFGKKNYVRAAALQRDLASEAQAQGVPVEAAVALYNLGNTLLAGGWPKEAADTFVRACDLCVEHELLQLAPMVYTNLGVALHRCGNFDQAFASLKVARDYFRSQGHRPGEAHVCDALAAIYVELGQVAKAAQAWRYALELYDGITNPTLADVREGGRRDIEAKLTRLGQVNRAR